MTALGESGHCRFGYNYKIRRYKLSTTMGKLTGRPAGVRLTKRQSDKCRAAIRATSLINRLQDNAIGKLRDKSGNPIEMTPSQVRSAEILLNKALPNLSSVERTNIDQGDPSSMSDAELEAIIRASEANVTRIKG